jgi:hypothetical protein
MYMSPIMVQTADGMCQQSVIMDEAKSIHMNMIQIEVEATMRLELKICIVQLDSSRIWLCKVA